MSERTLRDELQKEIERLEEEHVQRVSAAIESRLGETARKLCREHGLTFRVGNGGYSFFREDETTVLFSGPYGLCEDEIQIEVDDEWLEAMELEVFRVNAAGSLMDEVAINGNESS